MYQVGQVPHWLITCKPHTPCPNIYGNLCSVFPMFMGESAPLALHLLCRAHATSATLTGCAHSAGRRGQRTVTHEALSSFTMMTFSFLRTHLSWAGDEPLPLLFSEFPHITLFSESHHICNRGFFHGPSGCMWPSESKGRHTPCK